MSNEQIENKKAGKGSPQMSIETEAMDGLMKVMRRVIATPPQPRKAKPKPKPKPEEPKSG